MGWDYHASVQAVGFKVKGVEVRKEVGKEEQVGKRGWRWQKKSRRRRRRIKKVGEVGRALPNPPDREEEKVKDRKRERGREQS